MGSVSAVGVIPVAPKSMDSVGVMAKSVWDLVAGLGAIVDDEGADLRYLEALKEGSLAGWEGLKIGVMDMPVFWDPKMTGEQVRLPTAHETSLTVRLTCHTAPRL